MMLEARQEGSQVHLEAWVRCNLFVRLMSLFMLPETVRTRELVKVLGHEAAIWCVGRRTFVLVSREPKGEVERMASFVQAALR